jgi:hypothetical protein
MKYKKWTKEDLAFIVENFNIMSDADIAKCLSTEQHKVTVYMIRRQRRTLKANKVRGRPRKRDRNQ